MTCAKTRHPPHLKFPLVLHTMLEDAEAKGFEPIVSWLPNSNMFKIHNSAKFTRDILKDYFPNQKFYKSFLRQLNIYGFNRVNAGSFRGAYYHSSFVRGDRELPSLHQMERVWVNTSAQAFYSNESCGFLIAPSCKQGKDKTAPLTPPPMEKQFWPSSSLSSWSSSPPCEKPIAEPAPIGLVPPSTIYPRVLSGEKKGVASPWEQGILTKYAPSIPDVLVGDIIYLFGSNENEGNMTN
jgi:hypothetical protein